MKKTTFLYTITAAAILLAGSPAAKAVSPMLGLVNPGDTFTFDYSGFNSTSGAGFILGGGTATFGTPLTLATGGVNGQSITLTSTETSECHGGHDHGYVHAHHAHQFHHDDHGQRHQDHCFAVNDIGNANSGVIPGAPDTVDYALPVTGNTQTGGIIYNTNSTFALTPDHHVDQQRHVPRGGGRCQRWHHRDLHPRNPQLHLRRDIQHGAGARSRAIYDGR